MHSCLEPYLRKREFCSVHPVLCHQFSDLQYFKRLCSSLQPLCPSTTIRKLSHNMLTVTLVSLCLFAACMLQVGEFRAHAAEWTANVTAEFKETRRRLSVEIYDKFQRATSIKRKLSAELAGNHNQELTPCRRTLSVNHLASERDVLPPLLKTESIYLNGLTPHCAGEEIAVIENIK